MKILNYDEFLNEQLNEAKLDDILEIHPISNAKIGTEVWKMKKEEKTSTGLTFTFSKVTVNRSSDKYIYCDDNEVYNRENGKSTTTKKSVDIMILGNSDKDRIVKELEDGKFRVNVQD